MTYFEAAASKPTQEFRSERARQAELIYYEKHGDKSNFRRRNELYEQILRLLGKNKHLIIEFAQRDAALYNPNTDYFYECGFSDALYFTQTLKDMEHIKNTIETAPGKA